MDKRSTLALVLMTLLIMAWMIYMSVNQRPEPTNHDAISKKGDTAQSIAKSDSAPTAQTPVDSNAQYSDSLRYADKFGRYFSKFAQGSEQRLTIETDLFTARVTSKGLSLLRWELKNYMSWDKKPVQLIWNDMGELYMSFLTIDNKKIDSRNLYFEILPAGKDSYKLTGGDSLKIIARLEVEPGRFITKAITFYGDKYHINQDITLQNIDNIIPRSGYSLIWSGGLRYQEHNSIDESGEALAMTSMNGNIQEIDASDFEQVSEKYTGIIDFAAVKNKYFTAAIIPQPFRSQDGDIYLQGNRYGLPDAGAAERYTLSFSMPYRGGTQTNSVKVYIGPLDYDIVNQYGLSETINFGWRWIVRPIGEYFMLPIFNMIHYVIPNYGIAILVFSIIMKLLLYPLSITQMRSAQKMQLLAPEMQKIRDQYKDDNTKQQQAIMKMYSEYGINPMGGCLPLLLQMPILYALWSVLRASIDLRQADFIWWITDLSVPDVILHLPFKVPLIGMDQFSGLAVLMGVTLFFQQKMTLTDPRQKAMIYMMPIMFTFLFSSFPSGLNLYYFMFNLMSIIQQVYINKFSRKKLTLADLRTMPKKEGWLQKKMREAQDIAAAQGRSIPGQQSSTGGAKQDFRKRPTKKKK